MLELAGNHYADQNGQQEQADQDSGGKLTLDVPVFLCGECGAMRGGMDVIGKWQTRKLYSKKYAMRLAALEVSYERVGNMLGFAKSTLCKWLK